MNEKYNQIYSDGKIIGLATDGDIRYGLLKGIDLESPICLIVNRDFYFGREDTPHELLLKQLDSKIKFIPILDNNNKLIQKVGFFFQFAFSCLLLHCEL